MKYGTAHFNSVKSAQTYYAPYGYSESEVLDKFDDEEIFLGKPAYDKATQTIELDTLEGRYFVVEK